MIMELLPVDPERQLGIVPPRLRFTPECAALVNFLQWQFCYEDDLDVVKRVIAEVKRGDRERDMLINHRGSHAEITASTAEIYDASLDEEGVLATEMPLAQFERIIEIWRAHCRDEQFVGTFEV